jgi:hypothetical protein
VEWRWLCRYALLSHIYNNVYNLIITLCQRLDARMHAPQGLAHASMNMMQGAASVENIPMASGMYTQGMVDFGLLTNEPVSNMLLPSVAMPTRPTTARIDNKSSGSPSKR